MSFRPVTQNIFRMEFEIDVAGLMTLPVNIWLVRAADGWTLIDSGPPQTGDQVVAALSETTQGYGPSQVLLTHGHIDHVGGLQAIQFAWKTPIVCHEAELPYVSGELDYRDAPAKGLLFMLARYFFPSTTGTKVARKLQRGESIAGMIAIHLPGHTPGHIGFLHPREQAMICGDALMNRDDRLSPPYSVATADPKQARNSMYRLSELDFVHLLPSHGEPILNHGHSRLLEYLGKPPQEEIIEPW
jgi:glyoxylase-like metal-dependent hydrolase (beta-lactamase superfamily II)